MKNIDFEKIFNSMKANDISELIIKEGSKCYEVRRGGIKQDVVQGISQPSFHQPLMPHPVSIQPAQAHAPAAAKGDAGHTASAETSSASKESKSDLYEIKSPLVGTFYGSPKPDAPAFVDVGTKISKGQVLCIVEAMKNFNEIESEVDGVVEEICVKNEELVEFGKVLFRVKLS